MYIPAAIRPVLILAALTALAFWTVGEDFGGMLTGQGTDPSTGPLLVLLAAAFWPLRRSSQVQRRDGPAQPAGTGHSESAGTPGDPTPATAGQGAR